MTVVGWPRLRPQGRSVPINEQFFVSTASILTRL
jgi:hypothetical protein